MHSSQINTFGLSYGEATSAPTVLGLLWQNEQRKDSLHGPSRFWSAKIATFRISECLRMRAARCEANPPPVLALCDRSKVSCLSIPLPGRPRLSCHPRRSGLHNSGLKRLY